MGRKKKIAALCGGIAVAAVLGYAAYVLLTYHRIPDGKETGIEKKAENHVLKEEQSYTISSYNIGFGAYTPEFTFFMDGGKQSVAESPESVVACMKGAGVVSSASANAAILDCGMSAFPFSILLIDDLSL